jgi:hypothetical protein
MGLKRQALSAAGVRPQREIKLPAALRDLVARALRHPIHRIEAPLLGRPSSGESLSRIGLASVPASVFST